MSQFKECPFCFGGSTNLFSISEELAKAKEAGDGAVGKICIGLGGARMAFVVEHFCEPIERIHHTVLSFYGKTAEDAIGLWNKRGA